MNITEMPLCGDGSSPTRTTQEENSRYEQSLNPGMLAEGAGELTHLIIQDFRLELMTVSDSQSSLCRALALRFSIAHECYIMWRAPMFIAARNGNDEGAQKGAINNVLKKPPRKIPSVTVTRNICSRPRSHTWMSADEAAARSTSVPTQHF